MAQLEPLFGGLRGYPYGIRYGPNCICCWIELDYHIFHPLEKRIVEELNPKFIYCHSEKFHAEDNFLKICFEHPYATSQIKDMKEQIAVVIDKLEKIKCEY